MNISVENISLSAGGRQILKNISASFPSNAATVIYGDNGCGKSSLIKVISGLKKPDHGKITYGDEPLENLPLKRLARIRSVMLQHPYAPGEMSVNELLSLARYPFGAGRIANEKAVTQALEDCRCTDLRYRKLSSLSGGEYRKCFFAMALAQEPEILILDEPEANMDAAFRSDFPILLKRITAARTLTVIMVMHDLDLALHSAEYFLGMKDGRAELFTSVNSKDSMEKISRFTEAKYDLFTGDDGKLRALTDFTAHI